MSTASGRLHQALTVLKKRLQSRMRSRWQRDLPFEELLFDRWERAASLGFGRKASIYQSSFVYGEVAVGEGTWIGPFTLLDGTGGLRIGAYCSISAGAQIYTHDTVEWALTGGQRGAERSPVVIGDNCYVGSQAVVAKGVTIGDHTVVGACSFVNRDLPAFTVAAGVPCRPIGRVHIEDDGKVTLCYESRE